VPARSLFPLAPLSWCYCKASQVFSTVSTLLGIVRMKLVAVGNLHVSQSLAAVSKLGGWRILTKGIGLLLHEGRIPLSYAIRK
jgi:hypothetical protein